MAILITKNMSAPRETAVAVRVVHSAVYLWTSRAFGFVSEEQFVASPTVSLEGSSDSFYEPSRSLGATNFRSFDMIHRDPAHYGEQYQ